MTSLAALETLVAISHPDVLADMHTVFAYEHGAHETMEVVKARIAARVRVRDFLGADTFDDLRVACFITDIKIKTEFILVIASKSSVETIRDAYDDSLPRPHKIDPKMWDRSG